MYLLTIPFMNKSIQHAGLLFTIGVFCVGILFTTSCSREDEKQPTPTTESVKFTLTSQIEGKTFNQGDTVWIKMELSYSQGLHGYEATIKNKTDKNTVVFETDEHVHGNTATITAFWVNTVKNHSDMYLAVKAIKDHDGNGDTKEYHFHCHP